MLKTAGLVLLEVGRDRSARLTRAAGWVLVVGATATALCTGYFWLRYHQEGHFDHAEAWVVVETVASALDPLGIEPLA